MSLSSLPDTCRIATVSYDGYGDRTVETLTEVKCLFNKSSAYDHTNNVDSPASDANVYLDTNNGIVMSKGFGLEGMYLNCNPFGALDDDSWYRIVSVEIGQRKLLTNEVDNVHAFLTKVAKPE